MYCSYSAYALCIRPLYIDDPYTDTKLRIPKGLALYSEKFGLPTAVFYRCELWDLHLHRDMDPDKYHVAIDAFLVNYEDMLVKLQDLLPPTVLLGIHTVPTIGFNRMLFVKYSSAMRLVASRLGLLNVDWNRLMTDSNLEQLVYLRDDHHPTQHYTAEFGKLLLRISLQDILHKLGV